jgi:hypothetical protein
MRDASLPKPGPTMSRFPSVSCSAAALVFVLPLVSQWPTSPSVNLPIGDRTGEQATPKLAATADGGCYIAWFDNASGNYDVYLQRLDAAGVEQWPHNGVLVSSQPQQSSLVDWDLVADSAGGAVIAFCDIRNGPDLDVYAYRFSPTGMPVWGANGVTLSNNADFEAAPQLAETSDGEFVVAWSRSPNSGTGSIVVQKLTAAGTPRFLPDGIAIPGDPNTRPGFVDVAAVDGAGGFALAWARDTSFLGNRYLYAQKFDANGQSQWGMTPLSVFDSNSMPIAHQARIVGDGAGGAWLAWHFSLGSLFTTRTQRIDSTGAEVFAHDGIDVSIEANTSKLDPAIALETVSGDLLVAFGVRNSGQSQWGVSVQRVTAAGALLWTGDGTRVAAFDGINEFGIRLTPYAGGAMVLWLEQASSLPQETIRASRVDAAGQVAWVGAPLTVASTVSEKLRPAVDATPSGVALVAWSDRRTDSGDVYAQNVNPNGALGARLASAMVYGSGVNPAGSMAVGALPRIGSAAELLLDNPPGTQPAGTLPFVLFALAPDPAFPSGTQLPGFGMAGVGAAGELLLDGSTALGGAFPAPVWSGSGTPSVLPVPVPFVTSLAGVSLYAQALFVDPTPGASVPLGLTDAAVLTVGF